MTEDKSVGWDETLDTPKNPPKYKRGQLVVAQVWMKSQGKAEMVCEVWGHMTCGRGCVSDENGIRYTPPNYLYILVGVEDGERYQVMEDEIGRFIPPVEEGWEPLESK